MTALFIIGYAVVYFITIYNIFRHADALGKLKCICGQNILVTHRSIIECPHCEARFDVEEVGEDKEKLEIKLILQEGEVMQECIDCHNKFIIAVGFEGIKSCPSCPRRSYIRNVDEYYYRALPRKCWWRRNND